MNNKTTTIAKMSMLCTHQQRWTDYRGHRRKPRRKLPFPPARLMKHLENPLEDQAIVIDTIPLALQISATKGSPDLSPTAQSKQFCTLLLKWIFTYKLADPFLHYSKNHNRHYSLLHHYDPGFLRFSWLKLLNGQ